MEKFLIGVGLVGIVATFAGSYGNLVAVVGVLFIGAALFFK